MTEGIDRATAARTIESAGAEIVGACRRAPDAPVPSCPGWSVSDLAIHIAQIHQWAAGLMAGGAPGPLAELPEGTDPADWADHARAGLVGAIEASDPVQEVWTFIGPRPASWWWRRQVNETVVHAWDATAALGSPWPIPADVAADALDEALTVFLPRRWGHKSPDWGEGRTVHLHRTDGDGEWLVRIDAEPTIEQGHAKGDLAVRGPAVELLLWALGRGTGNQPAVELFGDSGLADAWRANVRI